MDKESLFQPIGYLETCFQSKNGTPRQPSISQATKGKLSILKTIFNNPEHSLCGLSQFSHVWILFWFHLNQNKHVKAKVQPPRLDGLKTGVFATRSPHRPNAIGLTLARLERVENDSLFFSGLDIVNGTPVVDIKPYIPDYDMPGLDLPPIVLPTKEVQSISKCLTGNDDSIPSSNSNSDVSVASWINKPSKDTLDVTFTERALQNITKLVNSNPESKENHELKHVQPTDFVQVVKDILRSDPRSSYRRQKCNDRLYYLTIDNVHVTAWFDETTVPTSVEVLRVVPATTKGLDLVK